MMLRARRLLLVFGCFLFLLLAGLFVRLAWLATTSVTDSRAQLERLVNGARQQPAPRGQLLDRHGLVLARSLAGLQVVAWTPRILTNGPGRPRALADLERSVRTISERLAPLIELSPGEIAPLLTVRTTSGGGVNSRLGRPIVAPDRIDGLLEQLHPSGDLRRLDAEPTWTRAHPNGATAGTLLGFVLADGTGGAGLEHGLESLLAGGPDGRLPHRAAAGGFRMASLSESRRDPVGGCDVLLTIDVGLQAMVEQELEDACRRLSAVGASAVVLDVATAEVLALASAPNLDPDDRSTWHKQAQVVRPVQTVYPPGSTFKPVMMAFALDAGLVHPGERLDCSPERGRFKGRARMVRDTHPTTRPLTLEEVIVESSNVGMSNILTRLVPEARPKDTALMRPLHETLKKLGLGRTTGAPVAAESAGLLTRLSTWSRPNTLVSLSFGYEVAVTPLQMAAIAATLADGRYRRPTLVREIVDREGQRLRPPPTEPVPVFTRATADRVRGYMQSVVELGQARTAGVPGVPVAGKTGTSEHVGQRSVHDPERRKQTHSFVALVPAGRPRLAVVVVLEEPTGHRFAAQTTAPVVGAILRRALPYLGISEG
jgi:cell division protein FtsI (penicillin-binding protein 3)